MGLWAYGCRFLVYSENRDQSCRGSCYWIIDQHLSHPKRPLEEIARVFEDGAPEIAIQMHRQNMIPDQMEERQIWNVLATDHWPSMPPLHPGIYTFLIGYSKDANHPGKAHRVVLFNEEKKFLFDPSIGLSEWEDSDWVPLLDRIASDIRSSEAGYFTIECNSY